MRQVGPTGVWPLVRTARSNGTSIDEASPEYHPASRSPSITITPGRFAKEPQIAPLDPRAGARTSLQLNFTSSNWWPSDGTLQLALPSGGSGFTDVDATIAVMIRHDEMSDNGARGQARFDGLNWQVNVSRDGSGVSIPPHAPVSLTIGP